MRELQDLAAKVGLTAKELSPGHWRIEGGERVVDYWPMSKRKTAFVVGSQDSTPRATPQQAIAMAGKPAPRETVEDRPARRTIGQWISLLPHLRFAWGKKERAQ